MPAPDGGAFLAAATTAPKLAVSLFPLPSVMKIMTLATGTPPTDLPLSRI